MSWVLVLPPTSGTSGECASPPPVVPAEPATDDQMTHMDQMQDLWRGNGAFQHRQQSSCQVGAAGRHRSREHDEHQACLLKPPHNAPLGLCWSATAVCNAQHGTCSPPPLPPTTTLSMLPLSAGRLRYIKAWLGVCFCPCFRCLVAQLTCPQRRSTARRNACARTTCRQRSLQGPTGSCAGSVSSVGSWSLSPRLTAPKCAHAASSCPTLAAAAATVFMLSALQQTPQPVPHSTAQHTQQSQALPFAHQHASLCNPCAIAVVHAGAAGPGCSAASCL